MLLCYDKLWHVTVPSRWWGAACISSHPLINKTYAIHACLSYVAKLVSTQVSYQQLYGWTMDEIVGQIGTRNNCTFCGVFRCACVCVCVCVCLCVCVTVHLCMRAATLCVSVFFRRDASPTWRATQGAPAKPGRIDPLCDTLFQPGHPVSHISDTAQNLKKTTVMYACACEALPSTNTHHGAVQRKRHVYRLSADHHALKSGILSSMTRVRGIILLFKKRSLHIITGILQ